MAWARLDDNFPDHPKVLPLSADAFRVHVSAICYAQRTNTRGAVPRLALPLLRAKLPHVRELVTGGLWEETAAGWEIHDFLEYNPARPPSSERSAAKEAAGRIGGQRSGEARRRKRDEATKQTASSASEANQGKHAKQNGAFASEPPVPSHPNDSLRSSLPDPADDDAWEMLDLEFRERYGELVTAYGGNITARMADDFKQIAEDYALDDIQPAIRSCRENNERGYPSQVRKYLLAKHPKAPATMRSGAAGQPVVRAFANKQSPDEGA